MFPFFVCCCLIAALTQFDLISLLLGGFAMSVFCKSRETGCTANKPNAHRDVQETQNDIIGEILEVTPINPATGLPGIGNNGVDVGGNVFGFESTNIDEIG